MKKIRLLSTGLVTLALMTSVTAADARTPARPNWVTAWATSQMIPGSDNALAPEDQADATLRQIVRVTSGGTRIRLKLSNAFGTAPLRFDAVSVAASADNTTARIVSGTSHAVTFGGQVSVTIPAGAEYVSDPIDMAVAPLSDIVISTWQSAGVTALTSHPGSRATSYLVHGNHVADTDLADSSTSGAKHFDHWFDIAAIDVEGPATTGAIAVLGDSITDGYGVKPNTNTRWPDALMQKLQAAHRPLSVLNFGIGGNRLLLDGLGPNALARLDRDVFAQAGVKYLVVFEGVNDLGTLTRDAPVDAAAHADLVTRMLTSYAQLIDQAHAHGLTVIGATITPYMGNTYYHPTAENEADRQAINAWIRAPGHFDGVIDFDAIARDPADATRLNPAYDSGDHLHPTNGYTAMGNAVDLGVFR